MVQNEWPVRAGYIDLKAPVIIDLSVLGKAVVTGNRCSQGVCCAHWGPLWWGHIKKRAFQATLYFCVSLNTPNYSGDYHTIEVQLEKHVIEQITHILVQLCYRNFHYYSVYPSYVPKRFRNQMYMWMRKMTLLSTLPLFIISLPPSPSHSCVCVCWWVCTCWTVQQKHTHDCV